MNKCSKKLLKISSYLHLLSILLVSVGTVLSIIEAERGEQTYWLPLSLAILIVLRLPNQICVAMEVGKDGWYTVIGSILGLLGFIVLTYFTYKNKH